MTGRPRDSTRELAERLARLEQQLRGMARSSQLRHSSIDDGALTAVDAGGTLRAVIGELGDGSYGAMPVNGTPPPRPAAPAVDTAPGGVLVTWDGAWADAAVAPLDFARVEVHVGVVSGFSVTPESLRVTIESPRGGSPLVSADTGLVYVRLVAVNTSGRYGVASAEVLGESLGVDGGITVFYGPVMPEGPEESDLWVYRGDDGNTLLYRWSEFDDGSGFGWLEVRDQAALDALIAAGDARAIADGKIKSTVGPNPPVGPSFGDLWVNTARDRALFRWDGRAWEEVRDSGIVEALQQAGAAQIGAAYALTTANGKGKAYYQTAPPMGASTFDLWFDTGDGNAPHRWDGAAWARLPLGDAAIGNLDAGKITTGELSTQRLGVGAVGGDRLTASFGANLVHDGAFTNVSYWTARLAPAAGLTVGVWALAEGVSDPDGVAGRSVSVTAGEAGGSPVLHLFPPDARTVPVAAGDRYHVGASCRTGEGGVAAGAGAYIALWWRLVDGTAVEGARSVWTTGATLPWTRVQVEAVAPAGAVAVEPRIGAVGHVMAGGSAGVYYFDKVSVTQAIVGSTTNGQGVAISPSGVRLFDVDGEEVISLTSTPPNYLTIRDSTAGSEVLSTIGADGRASFQALSTGEVEIGGQALVGAAFPAQAAGLTTNPAALLEALPWGVVAYGSRVVDTTTANNTAGIGIFEIAATLHPGRFYRIHTSPVRLARNTTGTFLGEVRIHRNTATFPADPAAPTVELNVIARTVARVDDDDGEGLVASRHFAGPGTGSPALNARFMVAIGVPRSDTTLRGLAAADYPIELILEDIGRNPGSTGRSTDGGGAMTRTYTKRYPSTWAAQYAAAGALLGTPSAQVGQGYDPVHGDVRSQFGFDDGLIRADLAGATVTACNIVLYATWWYHSTGGTALIGTHANSLMPTTYGGTANPRLFPSSRWPKPGGRRVDLGVAIGNEFKSGLTRGVMVGPGGSVDRVYSGRFGAVGARAPYVEITFVR